MKIYPNTYLKKVEDIEIDFLKEQKIKTLILDVDNTLIDYGQNLKQSVIEWANHIKGHGFKIYILSNSNDKTKVEKVANALDVPYKYFAKKPSKKKFIEIQKEVNQSAKEIAVVGDQIFTDIIGGNRAKMYTILVDPINPKDFWYTAWKRPLEELIKNRFKKKQMKEKM